MLRESAMQWWESGFRRRFGSARTFLPSVVMCGIEGAAPIQACQPAPPPNIILFLSDDQGIDAIQGARWPNDLNCITPIMAQLAASGRAFSQFRVNPTCSPTRAVLLTGRSAFQTGVMGVIPMQSQHRNLVSLQHNETTFAEMLHRAGYDTIHVDKWHLGYESGQSPLEQGFDISEPTNRYFGQDDPIEVGDEHITHMVDAALRAVRERHDLSRPYALFLATTEPHRRLDASGREPRPWWKVAPHLLPSKVPYYSMDAIEASSRHRYRAVVEAMDTELGRMLASLGIIDSEGRYRRESHTVVFVLSDNGTPQLASLAPAQAKRTLYDGGIRVPLIVFGERVPADGRILEDLVSGVDIYDTLADIAGLDAALRGDLPRLSLSFADRIGWSDRQPPRRKYSLSSNAIIGSTSPPRVALTDARYKLVVDAGGGGIALWRGDQFYDLTTDPFERRDLANTAMSPTQRRAYLKMRDAIVDYWSSAVTETCQVAVDVPPSNLMWINSNDQRGTVEPMPLGHANVGRADHVESRLLVRFDLDQLPDLLPPGVSLADITAAQIVMYIDKDSQEPDNTDTGPITVRQITHNWIAHTPRWSDIEAALREDVACGEVDLPPYFFPQAHPSLGAVPLWTGTPVSLGHRTELRELLDRWCRDPSSNFGVALLARPLNELAGDQSITVKSKVFLRLTLPMD